MARLYDEPQGGVGEADAVEIPANPVAQNAATAALKPKVQTVPTEALPGMEAINPQAQPIASETNPDPNAYAPPPQQMEQAKPMAGGIQTSVPPTPLRPQVPEWSNVSTAGGPMGQVAPGPSGPPLPEAAPISTLSGDWQAPTASAQSAPLIASAAGGTMTPQGDASNPFKGYQTDQGGGFGGYGSAIMPDTGTTMKDYDAAVADKLKAMNFNFADINPNDLMALSRGAPKGQVADTDALRLKLYRGGTLTPAEQYALSFESGNAPQVYRPEWNADGSLKSWSQSANDMNALGGAKDLTTARTNMAALEKKASDAQDRRQREDQILAATFVPGVGSARVESNGNVVNPATGQVIGTVNDDPAKLKAAMGATGDFAMSANGQVIPASPVASGQSAPAPALPQAAPVGAPTAPAPAVPFGGVQNVPAQPALPQPSASGAPFVAPKTASGMGNVAQTAVTPQNTLTNALLSRGEGADRFKIAQDQYKASEEADAPRYEADLRRAMRLAAAGGALGSGQLQTSLGDIAQNRDLFNRTNRTNFLSEALKGTIGDQFADVGVAQQQQGFQNQQQQQAFQQAIQKALTEDSLTGSGFSRALQMLTAGSGGNPADLAMTLSQIFGGQSSAAGSSLAGLLGGMGQKSTAPSGGTDINSLLALIYGNKPGTTTTTPTSTTVYGGQ